MARFASPCSARRSTVAVLLAAALFAAACGDNAPARQQAALPSARSLSDTLAYRVERVDAQRGDCADPVFDCLTVTLSRPVFTGSGPAAIRLNDSLNARILAPLDGGPVPDSAPAFVDAVDAAFRDLKRAFPERPLPGWSVERHAAVLRNGPVLISLRIDETLYTGGAHALSTETLWMLDPATAEFRTLADLCAPGDMAALTRLAERHFRRSRNLSPGASLEAAGFRFDGGASFTLPEQAAVTADGLRLHYNPYEIAAYALGATTLTIPATELLEELAADSPLHTLLEK